MENDTAPVCDAELYIGDDHGDNHATMRCEEPAGHDPPHREVFFHNGGKQRVVVTWTEDEREECDECKKRVENTIYCDACTDDLCEACFGRPPDFCKTCLGNYCSRCEVGHACVPYESIT